ncbi:transcription-repair coupling factor, partial [Campylobacter novaezeelandiae]|nr:transcription-repair coupling factor [Campylobacter novaezeelandiae]
MQAAFYEFLQNNIHTKVIICEDDKEADLLAQVSNFQSYKTFVLPDFRAEFGDDLRSFSKELFEICRVLDSYYKEKEKKKILISPIATLLHKLPGESNLKNYYIYKNEKFDFLKFKEQIEYLGYEFVDIVQDKAEVSIRGDVIDIFCINKEKPIRISFFADEIESIREFDINTQKSI